MKKEVSMRLKGKITLITGSGSGIGKSIALLFARTGATVFLNELDAAKGAEVTEEICKAGGTAFFIQSDVTALDSVKMMIEQVIARYGRIDVLFNNAGISGIGALHELEQDMWDRIMNVNIKGVFLPSKYVLPHMMQQMSGSIINMSSCIAEIGLARRAAYAASKGAILALTKSMQVDYAEYGIRVYALLPGTIYTPFVENYLKTSYENPGEAINSIKNVS